MNFLDFLIPMYPPTSQGSLLPTISEWIFDTENSSTEWASQLWAMKQAANFEAFPYVPYGIQKQFMQAVYSAIHVGGVGIVESPTGQSLSYDSAYWYQAKRCSAELFVLTLWDSLEACK